MILKILLVLICVASFATIPGCGSSGETNITSGWLGANSYLPENYSINISPLPERVVHETKVPVTVSVTKNDLPASGVKVSLKSSNKGAFAPDTGSTYNGKFFSFYSAPADFIGTDTITACLESSATSTNVLVGNSVSAALNIDLTLEPAAIYLNQDTQVVLQIKDQQGFPATAKVTLSSSHEGKFATETSYNQDITVKNGFFATTFTAGTQAGSATIQVQYGDQIVSKILSIEVPPTVLSFKNYTNRIAAGASQIIALQVTDDLGVPNASQDLIWQVNPSTGGIITEKAIDRENGYFYVTFTAGDDPGKVSVSALLLDALASISIEVY